MVAHTVSPPSPSAIDRNTALPRVGATVRVLVGRRAGRFATVTYVRWLAADAGVCVRGGEGLYGLRQFTLMADTRSTINPCGVECDPAGHAGVGRCIHCLGHCRYGRLTEHCVPRVGSQT